MAENIADQVLSAERVRKAVLLRSAGAHWQEVADQCGFPSPAAALRAVGEAMAAATMRAEETADQMRDTAQLRLEKLLSDAMSMIPSNPGVRYDDEGNELTEDDRAVRLKAVDTARRTVLDIAKLQGVSVPSKDSGEVDTPGIRIIGVAVEDIL